ncbi:MAG: hypothetical protein UH542_06130 [Bacteroidales bacterium]|nr:hypothetical protein [Bacteroidales bacterium]
MDRDEVIEELSQIISISENCNWKYCKCARVELLKEALTLIKKQPTAVTPLGKSEEEIRSETLKELEEMAKQLLSAFS